MDFSKSDVYAYQILHYLVVKQNYQIINIENQKQDFWLMNAKNSEFPIIRICDDTNGEVSDTIDYMRGIHRAILDIMKREGNICVFNTNPSVTPIHNEYISQYVFTPEANQEAAILAVFPDIYKVLHDVDDYQSECAALMRDLETTELKQEKARKKMANITMPKVTVFVILLCLVYFLFIQFMSSAMGNALGGVVGTGAYYKMNVVSLHEYWRLFTTGFMHLSIFHFLINMYALFNVGLVCEKVYKRSHYIILLILSIIVGNIFVFIGNGNVIAMGISGGIYGLMGAFIVYLFENGSMKHPMIRASVLRMLMINLLISFLPQVSMLAHLGGLITGVFLGIMFVPSKRWDYLKRHVAASFGMFVVFLVFLCTQVKSVQPLDKESDKMIIDSYHVVEWDAYADYTKQCYEATYAKEELK